MPNERTNGQLNTAFVRGHRCATCWGVLVEKNIDGKWVVACPKNCSPGGFVTVAFVDRRQSESRAEMYEVQRHYPFLKGK